MKKIIKACLYIAMLVYCSKSNAQVDTSTTQKLLQYIFQPVDKNQIPTGFLEEYGCPMLPAATFNGTLTDSNRIDMNLWRTLYLQLQTGWTRATANPLPAITSVNTTIKQNVSSTLPVPIPLLLASYNTVKSNAFTGNLLSYNSSTKKVSDVAGRTLSPYDPKTLFAACPNKNISVKGNESFIIQSNMIWNNTGKTISQIQIDFANGSGFQTVTIGTAINISYADTGFKKWTIKVTLNDNSILQCFNEYNVLKTANVSSRFQSLESVVPTWGNINAVNGTRAAATVWVNYSKNNFSGTLRKPLIVVEGYDVSFIAPSLQSDYDVDYFINEELSKANVPGWDFNGQLDDVAGYDLVFVNFADGAADIVLNAGALQEVINRVNTNKVNDGRFGNVRQQNVVMGLSMGGLCARYALANMTKNFTGTPTETRLLITHDSPHKGANVPLGLQYMIRMLGGVQLFGYNVYDIYPDYDDAIGLLNAPATQQLLLYRAISGNAFVNNTFLDATYRPMITFGSTGTQPTYRFITTSLGNECANPLFSPGKTFINLGAGVSAGIYTRFLFFKVPILSYKLATQVEAYALPVAGSTNKIAKVYTVNNLKLFGFINIFKQLYNNTAYAPGTHLAIDGVPGSNYPLLDVNALNQLTNLPIGKLGLYVTFPLGPFLGGYFGVYAYNAGVSYNFTFVSTASALDAGPYTTPIFSQKYVNGVNQNYPSSSETFIAQETVANNASLTNNVHIRFTARNSRWLFNEMENLSNIENCSSECSNPYYIAGNSTICTGSGTWSVPGLQRGATINWTVSPIGIVLPPVQNSGNSITLTQTATGIITLTATISNGCASTPPLTKVINIGAPGANIMTSQGSSCNNGYKTWTLNATSANGSNWLWSVDYLGNNSQIFIFNPNSPSTMVDVKGGGTVKLNFTDLCGFAKTDGITVYANCPPSFLIAPNPTTDNISVTADLGAGSTAAKTTITTMIYKIKITDRLGKVRKLFDYKIPVQTVSLSTTGLEPGIYTVSIYDGSTWSIQKLVVQ